MPQLSRRLFFYRLASCNLAFYFQSSNAQVAAPGNQPSTEQNNDPELISAIESATKTIYRLTTGNQRLFPPDHDFTLTLERLDRTNQRALSVINYVLGVPDFRSSGDTLSYAVQLARKYNLQRSDVEALARHFEATKSNIRVIDRLVGGRSREATAIALQGAASRVLALEALASSGRDPTAANNFNQLLDLAHSNDELAGLMTSSRLHFKVCERLRQQFRTLELLHESDPEDYSNAARITALRTALRASNSAEARRGVAEVDRKLQLALAARRSEEMRTALVRLFSGDGSSANPSATQRILRCKPRYAPITTGTDLYSGNPTPLGGEYLGQECTE